jgi:uncharacterized protein (TIGR00369 family)
LAVVPQGVVSGATLGILVDAPLGCTVQTALPPATPFTTAEISFKFLRTVVPQGGRLTAKGRLIHAGKSTGVSLVEVTDQVGRLVAVTSTRCAILPRVEVPWEVIEQALKNPPRLPEPDWPSPHPYERPVAGEVVSQEIWDGTDGLGVLQSLIAGDLPAPTLAHACGIAPVDANVGTAVTMCPQKVCLISRGGPPGAAHRSPHWRMAVTTCHRSRPLSVSRYSERGGWSE